MHLIEPISATCSSSYPPTRYNMGKTASGFCGANLIQIFVIILCGCAYLGNPRTITDSSPLDNLIIRPLFHKFRNFTFGIVGQTSLLKRTGKFYQSPLRRFPCDTSFGRSPEPPTSVHKLRPGKIDDSQYNPWHACLWPGLSNGHCVFYYIRLHYIIICIVGSGRVNYLFIYLPI